MTATTTLPRNPERERVPARATTEGPHRSALTWAVADSTAMIGRSLRHTSRAVDALILSVVLPVMLMLLFVYVFGGAIETGSAYIDYVVPGIIILCAGYGAAETGVGVCHDLVNRIIDRFRTLPIVASSVLIGHVVASVARNLVSTVVVIGVAFAIGFRPTAGLLEWLAAIGLILLFVLSISWVSVSFGLVAKTPEAASGFAFFLLFLPYVSSAFVPTDTMPAPLQAVADHQPITPLIEAIRGLLTGTPIGASAAIAVAWFASITVVAFAGSALLFRRRTAR
jgi:ABC-2 type transport system permease protein